MKTILLFTSLFTSYLLFSQTTLIPDSNFEQALINLGYDSGPVNGSISTASIDTITVLDVSNNGISNLSGIEDFISLTELSCYTNHIPSLDVSQNILLTYLWCGGNQLTNLDVSQNTLLTRLSCDGNQLTSLDVTQNTLLTNLYCYENMITSLDVSQNSQLTQLICFSNELTSLVFFQNLLLTQVLCGDNQLTSLNASEIPAIDDLEFEDNLITSIDLSANLDLFLLVCHHNELIELDLSQNSALWFLYARANKLTCLNVKNGTNHQIQSFYVHDNPHLECITVDDPAWAGANWLSTINKDPIAAFSSYCGECNYLSTGKTSKISEHLSVYPNPTTGNVIVDLSEFSVDINATLFNSTGQAIFTESFENSDQLSFSFSFDAPNGLYFLKIESDSTESKMIRVIKN